MRYQPDFFKETEHHRKGCDVRLATLVEHFDGGSVLDVGCSEGYNAFGVSLYATHVTAIDNKKENIAVCQQTAIEHNVRNVTFLNNDIEGFLRDNRHTQWDCILCLSVIHQIAGSVGLERASAILKRLSCSGSTMFFDMGQKNEKRCEKHQWWKELPTTAGEQEKWLRHYLAENTDFDVINVIGSSPVHGVHRLLWKLERS